MLYVYCDIASGKITNIHSATMTPPAGQAEVEVADGHDAIYSPWAWKLNTAQDNLEEDLLAIKVHYISQLYVEFGQMVEGCYTIDAKLAILCLYTEGIDKGWSVNRVPYLQTFVDWANGVMATMYVKKNEILALTTRAAVESFDWTVAMDAEKALDPKTDLEIALSYTD